jgi:hypothetical protein
LFSNEVDWRLRNTEISMSTEGEERVWLTGNSGAFYLRVGSVTCLQGQVSSVVSWQYGNCLLLGLFGPLKSSLRVSCLVSYTLLNKEWKRWKESYPFFSFYLSMHIVVCISSEFCCHKFTSRSTFVLIIQIVPHTHINTADKELIHSS